MTYFQGFPHKNKAESYVIENTRRNPRKFLSSQLFDAELKLKKPENMNGVINAANKKKPKCILRRPNRSINTLVLFLGRL